MNEKKRSPLSFSMVIDKINENYQEEHILGKMIALSQVVFYVKNHSI